MELYQVSTGDDQNPMFCKSQVLRTNHPLRHNIWSNNICKYLVHSIDHRYLQQGSVMIHLILSGQFAVFIVEFCFVSDRWGEESVQIDKPSTLVLLMIIMILIMIIIMIWSMMIINVQFEQPAVQVLLILHGKIKQELGPLVLIHKRISWKRGGKQTRMDGSGHLTTTTHPPDLPAHPATSHLPPHLRPLWHTF